MAKKIKSIKCPQCGSSKATELRTDYYRCNSCGTDFFLDSDDINIYHHNAPNAKPVDSNTAKIIAYVVIAFVLFFFGVGIFSSTRNKSARSNLNTVTIPEKEKWSDAGVSILETTEGKPVYIKVGVMRGRNYEQTTHSIKVGFYNAKDLKEIKIIEMPISVEDFKIVFRHFTDGSLYFIINKNRLCKVNRQTLSAEEVSPDSYKDIPGLESGFAKIEFGYSSEGDVFKIMNNLGKEIYYYPVIAKTYDGSKEHYEAKKNLALMPESAPLLSRFVFSRKKSDYQDEKIQLVKYYVKATPGYPIEEPDFGWQKSFSENKKEFISQNEKKWGRVTDYLNFTPERLYFNPKVLGYNNKKVVINYKVTPSEDEKYILQAMDANDGKILWTVQTNKAYRDDYAIVTNDGVLVSCYISEVSFYNNDGKEISTLKNR